MRSPNDNATFIEGWDVATNEPIRSAQGRWRRWQVSWTFE
jgi:hypothetical protein